MTKTANLSLSDFDSVSTTSMEIKAYGSNDSTGAFIEGFTPDSPEWRAIRRKQAKNKQPTKLMLGKKANFIELEQSEGEHSEEDLMLIEVITDIKGIDGLQVH